MFHTSRALKNSASLRSSSASQRPGSAATNASASRAQNADTSDGRSSRPAPASAARVNASRIAIGLSTRRPIRGGTQVPSVYALLPM